MEKKLFNCIKGYTEDDEDLLAQCLWISSPGLFFILSFAIFTLTFTIFFEFRGEAKGFKKFVVKRKWKKKRR